MPTFQRLSSKRGGNARAAIRDTPVATERAEPPVRTLLVVTACLAAACSSSPPPSTTSETSATTTVTVAGAGRCEYVAQDGAIVTDSLIDKGCSDDKGSLRFGKHTVCKNGQRLWEMGDLIGLSGEAMIPRETKTGDGIHAWALFYRVCTG